MACHQTYFFAFFRCIFQYLGNKSRVIATSVRRGWETCERFDLSETASNTKETSASGSNDLITEEATSFSESESNALKLKLRRQLDEYNKRQSGSANHQQFEEDFDRTTISWSVYLQFIRAGYKEILTVLLLLYFLATQAAAIYSDYFISNW